MAFSDSASAVITSRSNARIKQLRAAFAGQARLSGGLVAIEGDNLLNEALRSGMVLKTIFISERRELPRSVPKSVEVLWLANDIFASVVETQSPQGIAALLVPPVHKLDAVVTGTPLIVVAAGLQDPGNLGTLIRSAEAFGATGVAAAVAEDAYKVLPAHEADLSQPTAILIGNEGSGLSDELLQLADLFVTIPCPGRVESLNAAIAASLLLYEASQQRASKQTA
jgi:TrmH family RNA methyltransferase